MPDHTTVTFSASGLMSRSFKTAKSPEEIRRAVEESLARIGLHLDHDTGQGWGNLAYPFSAVTTVFVRALASLDSKRNEFDVGLSWNASMGTLTFISCFLFPIGTAAGLLAHFLAQQEAPKRFEATFQSLRRSLQ